MRIALALLTLCSACAEPLPIRMSDKLDTLPDEVVEACDLWGIVCELSPRAYGAVLISLVEVAPGSKVLGQNWGAESCRPAMWVDPTSHNRVAHELGHILVGREHSDDESNVMWHAGAEDAEVTDAQLDAAEKGADRLVRCR
ncbi:MAG: hypothetical protein ACRCZP_20020 [Phycicoccus sp.]